MDEKIYRIQDKIYGGDLDSAEQDLLKIIEDEEIKEPEDGEFTHYTFDSYAEKIIYRNNNKRNVAPTNNISKVYCLLGRINAKRKNHEKAIECYDMALRWNPVSAGTIMKKAEEYKTLNEIEKFKIEVEKAYQYIYTNRLMAKYYEFLGKYYFEKSELTLANALYTASKSFYDNPVIDKFLQDIAWKENREPRFSSQEDVENLFDEHDIPLGFDDNIIQMIYQEWQGLANKGKEPNELRDLYRILYDMTQDKRFMEYINLKDERTGITVRMPEIWRRIREEKYEEYRINPSTIFFFETLKREFISVICDGKCREDQFEEAYNLNIENMKKSGVIIEAEYKIIGQKRINQVFTLVKINDRKIRLYQNYLIVNGYFINVFWQVSSEEKIADIKVEENNSLKMDMIWSLRGNEEKENVYDEINGFVARWNKMMEKEFTENEATAIMTGDREAVFKAIKKEYTENGINTKAVNIAKEWTEQGIKIDTTGDPFWTTMGRNVMVCLIFANLLENKNTDLSVIVEQTKNSEESVKILLKNWDKLNVPELQDIIQPKELLYSNKTFESILEEVRKAIN